jgi:glycolate oxidase FAD binding subunit
MSESIRLFDGLPPLPVFNPGNLAELSDTVRRAVHDRQAIYPFGGRTQLELGHSPTPPGIGLGLGNLRQVVDYPARDMTVTVEAGITINDLQRVLAAEQQRLPIDVPAPERATLGGAVAANTSGPRRYGFGTLRDYVIGISVVNDEGRVVKAGGRVVKNVAGYDLCKLYVGSLGTLGVITQMTLKLRPEPGAQAIVLIECGSDDVDSVLTLIHQGRTRPVAIDLFNPAAAEDIRRHQIAEISGNRWLLCIGFEDNYQAVEWQIEQLMRDFASPKYQTCQPRLAEHSVPFWRIMTEFQAAVDGKLTFKANVLPSAVVELCRLADALPERPLLQAHAGNGIVFGRFGGMLTLDRARIVLPVLEKAALGAHGNLLVLRCPVDWKSDLPVWGKPRGDFELMRRVKKKLDPTNTFNPGRFVDRM